MRKITTSDERLTVGTKVFRQYLSEIYSYDTLTPDEEYELCVKMKAGDEKAREKIVTHNLRFVVSVAKRYYGNNATVEDLVNEGNVGLIMATNHYDPTRGFKFISYAVWWIRRNILFFLNNTDSIIRIPNHKISVIGKIKEDYMRLEQVLEKQPNSVDIISHLGDTYSEEDVEMFYTHYLSTTQQLDKEIGGDGEGTTTALDMMENNVFPGADSTALEGDSYHRITMMMSHLNSKQIVVMTKIFGLNGEEPTNIEAIGNELGISKERVRQIKEKSLIILRNKMKINYIYM